MTINKNATKYTAGAITLLTDDAPFDLDPNCEINVALRMVKAIEQGLLGKHSGQQFVEEFINTISGFEEAPMFHDAVEELKAGKTHIRDFAAYCYLAGRMSTGLEAQ